MAVLALERIGRQVIGRAPAPRRCRGPRKEGQLQAVGPGMHQSSGVASILPTLGEMDGTSSNECIEGQSPASDFGYLKEGLVSGLVRISLARDKIGTELGDKVGPTGRC